MIDSYIDRNLSRVSPRQVFVNHFGQEFQNSSPRKALRPRPRARNRESWSAGRARNASLREALQGMDYTQLAKMVDFWVTHILSATGSGSE